MGILELEDDSLLEYGHGRDRIQEARVEKGRSRGWDKDRVALLIGQGPAGEKRDGPYREDIYSDEEVEGAGEDGEGSICDEDQGW